ncbi:hypothetical protein GSI_02220 [Ganoderma sinense ZZ0214-1]|uniref:Uncharacterized protein n=1 Tax=Ganoderma sinense ZZ0214-1 TaxID=1077348 RepID=A0A2G8SP14_9APHY|nr:hypothetical protein GSI_02220 [Ganoderma sinense ZZ0214-1]
MATKPHSKTTKAERNNDQLFPLFLNTFSKGTASEFATTAEKLAHWLKVDKAYYPKARPKIVELLETAHNAVREHSTRPNHPFHVSKMDDGVRPFAEPFIRLVRTVVPFYLLFPELSLQMRLRVLIQTICDDVDQFLSQQPLAHRSSTTPSIATTRTTPLSPPIQSPVVPQQPTPIVQASPVNGSATQPSVLPTPLAQLPTPLARKSTDHPVQFLGDGANGANSLTIKLPGRLDIRLEDFPPRTTPITPQVAAAVVSPSLVKASPTTDTMVSQSARPKPKKRKFDFSDVLEEDVKWYKDTRPGQPQDSSVSSSTSPIQATLTTTATVNEESEAEVMEVTRTKLPGSSISGLESKEAGAASSSNVVPDAERDVEAATTSRSLSMSMGQPVVPKSRSPSGPPKDAVQPTLKRKAPDDESDMRTAQASSASHSPSQSPAILPPSITRRRTSPPPSVTALEPDTTEAKSEASEPPAAAQAPSKEVLPSPLSSKKKKKKRKGPPGLRFLPEVPVKEELGERLGLGAAVEDQSPASGTPKSEEEVLELGTKSRSKTPPPDLTPPQKPSIPPPEPPPQDAGPPSADPSGSDSAAVPAVPEGEEVQAPDLPLDAVFQDTVADTASPDAMEVDAALQPEPNGFTPEHPAPEVTEQEEIAQEDDIRVEEPSQAQNQPVDDDIEMRDSAPVPEVAPASPGSNDIVTPLGQSEVLDSMKVNAIEDVNQLGDKDTTKPGAVSASSSVLDLLATTPIPPEEDMEDMDSQSSPFESNVIRLLSLERGHPSHTSSQEPVELHFTLTEEEAAQVARWNNREKTNSNLSTSMCVSLISYPLEQCAQAFECEPDVEQGELDVVGFGRPRPWPEDGSVYVVLDVSGDHGPPHSINVAPPFGFDTIHKPVDLGECGVHPGENTLHLFQFRDHSDRIFAVVLHHPTTAQLAALQAARDRERALEDWIEDLGRFNLTQLKLIAIPVGNVVSDS